MYHPPKKMYVDQLRKISTLEKLQPIAHDLKIDDENAKEQDNKFLRWKKEQPMEQSKVHQFVENSLVQGIVANSYDQKLDQYMKKNIDIDNQKSTFEKWSKQNSKIMNKDYKYKFYFAKASPPKTNYQKETQLSAFQKEGFQTKKDSITSTIIKEKYDFYKINAKRDQEVDFKNVILEEDYTEFGLQRQLKKFENYKQFKNIKKINEIKFLEKDFKYELGKEPNQVNSKRLLQTFIYKPMIPFNEKINVEYFRDLGLPSRNIQAFSDISSGKSNNGLAEQLKEDENNLQLLKSSELNIDKKQMNFYDIANITMRRITPNNFYYCQRSDKPTRAEVNQLYKKIQKFKHVQQENQNEVKNVGMMTDEIQDQEYKEKKTKLFQKSTKQYVNALLQAILKLKKDQNEIVPPSYQNNYNDFKKQYYNKILGLIKEVYKNIVNQRVYPLDDLKKNLQKVLEEISDSGYDYKILHFLLKNYEEVLLKYPVQDNLHRILNKKEEEQPKITKYKGVKIVKEGVISSKKIYDPQDRKKNSEKKSVTPIKRPILDDVSKTKRKIEHKYQKLTPTKDKTVKKITFK